MVNYCETRNLAAVGDEEFSACFCLSKAGKRGEGRGALVRGVIVQTNERARQRLRVDGRVDAVICRNETAHADTRERVGALLERKRIAKGAEAGLCARGGEAAEMDRTTALQPLEKGAGVLRQPGMLISGGAAARRQTHRVEKRVLGAAGLRKRLLHVPARRWAWEQHRSRPRPRHAEH